MEAEMKRVTFSFISGKWHGVVYVLRKPCSMLEINYAHL